MAKDIAAGDQAIIANIIMCRTLNPSCCGRGQCALFGRRRLFEGGVNKNQVWQLGGYYSRAASDRGNTVYFLVESLAAPLIEL